MVEGVVYKGCPRWSTHGSRVLLEKKDAAGVPHIALGDSHGANAEVLVRGEQPVWLGRDEFAYHLDASNVAIFSLSTRETRLVPDPLPEVAKDVALQSWDATTGRLMVQYLTVKGERIGATFSAPRMTVERVFHLPLAVGQMIPLARTGFLLASNERDGDDLLSLSYLGATATRRLHLPAFQIDSVSSLGQREAVLAARSVSTQIVVEEPWAPSQVLTVLPRSAAFPTMGRDTDIYVQAWVGPHMNIFRLDRRTGAAQQVTHGTVDIRATPSNDGGFFYTDFQRQMLRRCSPDGARCRDILSAAALPAVAAESPDGRLTAYLTLQGSSRLWVAGRGGEPRDLGTARSECAPQWTDNSRLWVLRGTEDQPLWSLLDISRDDRIDLRSVPVNGSAIRLGCRTSPTGEEGPHPLALRSDRVEVRTLGAPYLQAPVWQRP